MIGLDAPHGALAEAREGWHRSSRAPAHISVYTEDAFVTALKRHGWERPAPVVPPAGPADGVMAQDHDDPTAPLRVAESR